MKIIIITGPPYSGKGTQCEILEKELGYKHVSTGDRCRLEKETGTEIGKIMSAYEERGELVPDRIMKDLFRQILLENRSEKGIILDGYPRTVAQVDDLLGLVAELGLDINQVLNIEVPPEELLRRAEIRAQTSDRKDDQDVEVHRKRIRVFEQMTRPAIAHLQSRLQVASFDGTGTIDEVTEKISAHLTPRDTAIFEFQLAEEDFLAFHLYTASKSSRINRKKRNGRLYLVLGSLLIGTLFYLGGNMTMVVYFGAVALITSLFYPRYFQWRYKEHYRSFIRENYTKRFGMKETLEIGEDAIWSMDEVGESKIYLKEVEQVNETGRHFFMKLSTGVSLIIPKGELDDPELLRTTFESLGLPVHSDLDWVWR